MDLMDDIPLPFQTDSHHLSILTQDSPQLSPNPPPSVIDSNGQNLPPPPFNSSITANQLASGQTVTHSTHNSQQNQTNNLLTNASNYNNTSSTTTNVIINNIKTNTTTIGTTNLESGIVQPSSTQADVEKKQKLENNCLRNRWHTCPELHKAMDGVTYIADHTKKEEESTRVSRER